MTLAGALLLGRIFSLWNMLAYGVGIGLGVLLDRFSRRDFRGLKLAEALGSIPRAAHSAS